MPGCFDTFEIACRAVIGQQISVRAANKLAGRIVERYGERIETGIEGLDRAWPRVTEVRSLASIEDAFGELGLIKTRSRAIDAMATAIDEGELDLDIGAVAEEQMEALLRIRGIGPWSANYIAMRTMSYPDAFLETDAGGCARAARARAEGAARSGRGLPSVAQLCGAGALGLPFRMTYTSSQGGMYVLLQRMRIARGYAHDSE